MKQFTTETIIKQLFDLEKDLKQAGYFGGDLVNEAANRLRELIDVNDLQKHELKKANDRYSELLETQCKTIIGTVEATEQKTLRDEFAMAALGAMLGNESKEGFHCGANGLTVFPKFAYEWADAMLKARAE